MPSPPAAAAESANARQRRGAWTLALAALVAAVLGAVAQLELCHIAGALVGAAIYLALQVLPRAASAPIGGKAGPQPQGKATGGEDAEEGAEEGAVAVQAEEETEAGAPPRHRAAPPAAEPGQEGQPEPGGPRLPAAITAPPVPLARAAPRRPRGRASPGWRPGLASVAEAQLPSAHGAAVEGTAAEGAREVAGGTAAAGTRPRSTALCAQAAGQPPELPPGCTTVVLRHVPRRCTHEALVEGLRGRGYGEDVDLVYLPEDVRAGSGNVGFALLNLTSEAACRRFAADLHLGRCEELLPGFRTAKVFEVLAAPHQGRSENLRRLQAGPPPARMAARLPPMSGLP